MSHFSSQDRPSGGLNPPRLLTRLIAGVLVLALVLAPATWLGLGNGQAMAAPFSSASTAPGAVGTAAPTKPNIVVI